MRAVEHDERKLRQVDLMDLIEDLLPHARIRCRLFLSVEGIQAWVAVEVKVGCHRPWVGSGRTRARRNRRDHSQNCS